MLNSRLFQLPSSVTMNLAANVLQRPPIDIDPMALNAQRLQDLMNAHKGTSTTGSR